ncbi:beta-N-acetylhexosaminidase [Limnochorda pilosa]|uniref:beta-N-acetylhexosaminidase n=1 Tax=Limnochorda pilosa TaxID=1555112 RepID=A0A0K2SLB8_LIMPI|nr:beta-N-acetylhexosaminidase [Limnochorda pilosa]BAS27916.1 hypothetical protein LIP_2075 [Limnochorda pilosa]
MAVRVARMVLAVFLGLGFLLPVSVGAEGPTPLAAAGYLVIPEPRSVQLSGASFALDGQWVVDPGKVAPNDIAVRMLIQDMRELNGVELSLGSAGSRVIRLAVERGAVKTGARQAVDDQGYRMVLERGRITITGNSLVGLFYGVQTLNQLVKQASDGSRQLPVATIEDWPSYELRFLHWDTKHHQDRMQTLKRYLDWSARFKVNMISFEIADMFAYPSHPVIGAPGAFTPEELQDLVDYGLERHIQIVPNVQSPAHMDYVLKHPEFAQLRSDGSNYQANTCDERTYELLFDMYQDLINATRGVRYFHVSTDEFYYPGIDPSCPKPYTPENKSLTWIDFVSRVHEFMSQRDRRMIVWLEYPVWPEHISQLPSDVIDGVLGDDYLPPRDPAVVGQQQVDAEKANGMDVLAYTWIQGSDYLLPYTFERDILGGVQRFLSREAKQLWGEYPLGAFGAAWDDAGLHNEVFWLGWSAVANWSWTPDAPSVSQHLAAFMETYYGPRVVGMTDVYRDLEEQVRFFRNSWDEAGSRERGLGYGYSDGKTPIMFKDMLLPTPPMPRLPGLDFVPIYQTTLYSGRVDEAKALLAENTGLMERLQENLGRADRNQYNLEVLYALASFVRHHESMLIGLSQVERHLQQARSAAEAYRPRPQDAVKSLIRAYQAAEAIVADRLATFAELTATYEKSRFPKGRSVDGRTYFHAYDDVKNHWAGTRPDLSFMTAPEERIGLEGWMADLKALTLEYAQSHGLELEPIEKEFEPGA